MAYSSNFSSRWLAVRSWSLICGIAVLSCGCASVSPFLLSPREIDSSRRYTSACLPSDEAQIERGEPRTVIDAIGWVFGIPDKVLLWDRRVSNHRISLQTEQSIAEYLERNELKTTLVRLNQYRPIGDWRRLVRNETVGPLWRYSLGTLSVLGETIIPGRVFGGDHYNPYTDTIHIYSDIPSVALHEGGHAKDFARRKWKGTYAFSYLMPVVPLYHESLASSDVRSYLVSYGTPAEQAEAARILYPAYGTYLGNAAGTFFPTYSTPIYYGCVISGHIMGRLLARQILASSPSDDCTADPSSNN